MTAQNFKRNLFLNSYREGEKTLTLVCFLLMLKRDKKCLTLAVYFLCLETPGLPACYPLNRYVPFLWIWPEDDPCLTAQRKTAELE